MKTGPGLFCGTLVRAAPLSRGAGSQHHLCIQHAELPGSLPQISGETKGAEASRCQFARSLCFRLTVTQGKAGRAAWGPRARSRVDRPLNSRRGKALPDTHPRGAASGSMTGVAPKRGPGCGAETERQGRPGPAPPSCLGPVDLGPHPELGVLGARQKACSWALGVDLGTLSRMGWGCFRMCPPSLDAPPNRGAESPPLERR